MKRKQEIPELFIKKNSHLLKNRLEKKWNKVGTKKCNCKHNLNCIICQGDGLCLDCIAYGDRKFNQMCFNWKILKYLEKA